eukprot:403339107
MEFQPKLTEQNEILKDAIQIQRQKGERLINIGMKYIVLGMGSLGIYGMIYRDTDESFYFKVVTPFIMCFASLITLMIIKFFPQTSQIMPFILIFIGTINVTERVIVEFPHQFRLAEPLFVCNACQEFFNNSLHTDRKLKLLHSSLMWGYYILRNYYFYNYFNPDFVFCTIILIFLTDLGALQQEAGLKCIQELCAAREKEMKESFQSTLQIIPQGVIVIDKSTRKLCYANQEATKIFKAEQLNEIGAKLDQFKLKSIMDQKLNESLLDKGTKNQMNMDSIQEKILLLESVLEQPNRNLTLTKYLSKDLRYQCKDVNDKLFKFKKDVSQYILIRSNPILNSSQLMILISDISNIKQLEKTSKQIRSMFFSSIAHELRTPLNSIIPISQELLKKDNQDPSSRLFLEIIVNSAHHLENVIEDALDMNRLENNRFELDYEMVDICGVAKQVIDIMRLQIQQKGLYINLQISDKIPNTGIGISPEDVKKLFQFFGKVQASKEINKSGMGLGLTISKMIVSQMNGKISVKSVVDQGSQFKVEMPIKKYSNENRLLLTRSKDYSNNQEFFDDYDVEITENALDQQSLFTMKIPSLQMGQTLDELNRGDYQKPETIQLETEEDLWEQQITNNLQLLNQEQFTTNNQMSFANSLIEPNISQRQPLQSALQTSSINQIDDQINFHSRQDINVFLVDDAPYNLLVMQQLLKQLKQVRCVQTALNGKQAIEALYSKENICYSNNRAFSKFDYIFMDLHMPAILNMRQAEGQGQISFQRTIIVAFSAIPKAQFNQTKHNELFDTFLEKPITFEKLKTIISD